MKGFFISAALLLCLFQFLTASSHAQTSRLENNSAFVFDSSSMLFVAVQRHEIRVEIMVKVIPLLSLLGVDADGELLTVEQQAPLKSKALEFFANRFVLSLEGIPTKPGSAKADFLNVGDAKSVIKEKAVDEPVADAVLGLSYIFPLDQVSEYFQFAWNSFPEELGQMPAQLQVLDTVQQFELNKYMLTIDWNCGNQDFRLPVISPVPVEEANWLGRATLNKEDAVKVIGQLLTNIHHAFEYRDESTIYDKLAVSVIGNQLSSFYLAQRKRMAAINRGGPRVKILDVSMSEIEAIDQLGSTFEITGNWEVYGKVTHFGHTHDRRNRYRAKLTLLAINQQWKIIDIDVLEEKRI